MIDLVFTGMLCYVTWNYIHNNLWIHRKLNPRTQTICKDTLTHCSISAPVIMISTLFKDTIPKISLSKRTRRKVYCSHHSQNIPINIREEIIIWTLAASVSLVSESLPGAVSRHSWTVWNPWEQSRFVSVHLAKWCLDHQQTQPVCLEWRSLICFIWWLLEEWNISVLFIQTTHGNASVVFSDFCQICLVTSESIQFLFKLW